MGYPENPKTAFAVFGLLGGSECLFETSPSWFAALGLNELSVRPKYPLSERAPITVIIRRGNCGIPLGFVKLALPPNAIANFVAKIL